LIILDTHAWLWRLSEIVATAQLLGADLVTKDQRLRRYRHVKAIW
jgi:PIN domain nuclease of toxin-antitoxin system